MSNLRGELIRSREEGIPQHESGRYQCLELGLLWEVT